MTNVALGSVWFVSEVDAYVLVILGPFGAPDRPEFLVTPLYQSSESGFARSRIDVLIEPREGPFDLLTYAGVWNTRPMLASDLSLNLGVVTTAALEAVKDVYWATLNEQPLRRDRRLGRFQFLRRKRILRFQESELERWAAVSGKVWQDAESSSSGSVSASGPGVAGGCRADQLWHQIHWEVSATVLYHGARSRSSASIEGLRSALEVEDKVLRWTGEHDLGLLIRVAEPVPMRYSSAVGRVSGVTMKQWWNAEAERFFGGTLEQRPQPVPSALVDRTKFLGVA